MGDGMKSPAMYLKGHLTFGGLHSTKVAFALLTQPSRVQILARLPRFFYTA